MLQTLRPVTLSNLYRELLASGGVDGRPLSRRHVDYVHAVLRKALNDAVRSEQLLLSNPAERAKRRVVSPRPRAPFGPPISCASSSTSSRSIGWVRANGWLHTGAPAGVNRNLRWSDGENAP